MSDFATKQEVRDALATLDSALKPVVVDKLPDSGEIGVIYFVSNASSGNGLNDYCDEYVWVNGRFELIGHTSVDLSDYTTTEQTAELSKSVAEHTENSDIHVTAQQKTTWDAKQDAGDYVDTTTNYQRINAAKYFCRELALVGTGAHLCGYQTSWLNGWFNFRGARANVEKNSILTVEQVQTDTDSYTEDQLANQVLPKSYIEANFQEKGDYATSDELKDAVASTDAKVDEAKEAIATTDAKIEAHTTNSSIHLTQEQIDAWNAKQIAGNYIDVESDQTITGQKTFEAPVILNNTGVPLSQEAASFKLATLMNPINLVGKTYVGGSNNDTCTYYEIAKGMKYSWGAKSGVDADAIKYVSVNSSYYSRNIYPIREENSVFAIIPITIRDDNDPYRICFSYGSGCSGTSFFSKVKDITTDFPYVPISADGASTWYLKFSGGCLIDIVLYPTLIDPDKSEGMTNPKKVVVYVRRSGERENGDYPLFLDTNIVSMRTGTYWTTDTINQYRRNGFSNIYLVLDSDRNIHVYTDSFDPKTKKTFAKIAEFKNNPSYGRPYLYWNYNNFASILFKSGTIIIENNQFYSGDGDEFLRCMEALSYNAVIEKTTEPYTPTIPKDDEEEESEES